MMGKNKGGGAMFRDMLRKGQALTEEECLDILKREKRGVLSVLGDGGYPYGMPMNHWYNEADGKIYFHGGNAGHKLDALRRCDKASFCVYGDGLPREDGWSLDFRSVIVFGRVEILEDPERVEAISRAVCDKFTQDEAYIEDEVRRALWRTVCLCLTPEHISGKKVHEA